MVTLVVLTTNNSGDRSRSCVNKLERFPQRPSFGKQIFEILERSVREREREEETDRGLAQFSK